MRFSDRLLMPSGILRSMLRICASSWSFGRYASRFVEATHPDTAMANRTPTGNTRCLTELLLGPGRWYLAGAGGPAPVERSWRRSVRVIVHTPGGPRSSGSVAVAARAPGFFRAFPEP